MKVLKWLVILVLGLAGLLALGGILLSPKFTVTRSVVVAAPAAKIYPLVADPRRWKDWSVWNERDPAMAITYSGAESGAGPNQRARRRRMDSNLEYQQNLRPC